MLPFVANATNISGDMYVAPQEADANHPAPTTNAALGDHFGRINIDVADQEHVATTAYVKGAYNSAIAAVNAIIDAKQDLLYNNNTGEIMGRGTWGAEVVDDMLSDMDAGTMSQNDWSQLDTGYISAAGVLTGIKSQRVKIYTTWGNDTSAATAEVPFVTASSN